MSRLTKLVVSILSLAILGFTLAAFLIPFGYEDDLSRTDIWGDDDLGTYAIIATDTAGQKWLIIKNNYESKIPYRNESFYIVRDFVPSYVTRDLGFRPTFRVLCRLSADTNDDTKVDVAWDLRDGSRIK